MMKTLRFSVLFSLLTLFCGTIAAEDKTVTFDATVDLGTSTSAGVGTLSKDGIELAGSNGILGNGSEYRIYKASTLAITSTVGNITKIEFTDKGGNYKLDGFDQMTAGSISGSTWTGDAASVTFTAGGHQVRLASLVITIGEGGGEEPVEPVVKDTLTVAQAQALLGTLDVNVKSEAQYVKGIITQIDGVDTSYGNATFWISDDGQKDNHFYIYRALDLGNKKFESENAIKEGDVVVVYGQLVNYRSSKAEETDPSTPEMTQGGYIVTLNGKTERDAAPVELQKAENVKAFRALEVGQEATLTLTDAVVLYVNTYNNRSDIFVRDASGEGIDLYDLGITATAGQIINGTLNAKLGVNGGFPAAVKGTTDVELNVTVTDGTAEPEAIEIGLDELSGYYSNLVTVKGVTYKGGNAVNEDGDELALYDRFGNGLVKGLKDDGTKYDLVGLGYDGGSNYGPELVVISVTDLGGGQEKPEEPIVLTGDGSKENPYLVSDLKQLKVDNIEITDSVWVKGIIVGALASSGKAVVDTLDTNLALALEAGVTEAEQVVPVQLPKGDVRATLNVKDNPANIGKEVLLFGKIEKYFNVVGLKGVSQYVLEGGQTGVTAVTATAEASGAVYTLSGQRVSVPVKGIYVRQGRKFVK